MTETSVRREIVSGDANLVGNTPLEEAHAPASRAPRPAGLRRGGPRFAQKIQATLTDEDIATSFARFGLKPRKGVALCDTIFRPGAATGPWSARPMSAR